MTKTIKAHKSVCFSVVIEPEKLKKLKKVAEDEGFSVALLMRRIITSWLENHGNTPRKPINIS